LRTALPLASYLFLTVLFTYPLARAPATTIEWGRGDPLLNAYIVSWGAHALAEAPERVFDPPFYFPSKNALSLSEHLLSVSWLFAPLAVLNRPLLLYNATVFASFLFSAALFFLYLRRLGCRAFSAWFGGLLFGFTPWRYGHLGHAQLGYTWWIPVTLLLFEEWLERPRLLAAIGAGVSFALVFEASVYHGFFFAIFLLGYVPFRLVLHFWRRLSISRLFLLLGHSAAGLAAGLLLLAPSLLAYRRLSALIPNVNPLESLVRRGADVLDYVNPHSLSLLWGGFSQLEHPFSDVRWEMHAFPGSLALAAFLLTPMLSFLSRNAGLEPATRKAIPALAAGAFLCLLVSFGPVLHLGGKPVRLPLPYAFLHQNFPGFSALRVPARASFYVALSGAALAAVSLDILIRSVRSNRAAFLVCALTGAVALLDVAPHPLPYANPVEYERLRLAMRATDPSVSASGADLVLPICDPLNYAAPLASVPRFRALVNGKSGYLLPANGRIFDALQVHPFGLAQSDLLRGLNVTRLFLDRTRMSPKNENEMLAALSRAGGQPRSGGVWQNHHVVFLSWPPNAPLESSAPPRKAQ
jgi:hypothetical protein